VNKPELIDLVLKEIARDVAMGDLTAIEELLRAVPEAALIAYLPETQRHTTYDIFTGEQA
jgi:hypothetical protein